MEVGETYLVVEILGGLKVPLFKNKDKQEGDNQPHFKGNGVAIWVNKKQAPKQEAIEEDVL